MYTRLNNYVDKCDEISEADLQKIDFKSMIDYLNENDLTTEFLGELTQSLKQKAKETAFKYQELKHPNDYLYRHYGISDARILDMAERRFILEGTLGRDGTLLDMLRRVVPKVDRPHVYTQKAVDEMHRLDLFFKDEKIVSDED